MLTSASSPMILAFPTLVRSRNEQRKSSASIGRILYHEQLLVCDSLEHLPRVEFEQNTSSQFLLMLLIAKSIECARLGLLKLDDPRLRLHGTGWSWREGCREENAGCGCNSQINRTRRAILSPKDPSFPAVSPDSAFAWALLHSLIPQCTFHPKRVSGKQMCIAGVIRAPSSASTFGLRATSGGNLKLPVVELLRIYTPRLAMSRLSNSLKLLINAPAARPSTVPAPANIASVYGAIQQTAQAQNISRSSWLALSVGTYWDGHSCKSQLLTCLRRQLR